MKFITEQIHVEVEVDGVKVKGRILGTSEINAIRVKNYKIVEHTIVDSKTEEERKEERVVVGENFARDLFVESIVL